MVRLDDNFKKKEETLRKVFLKPDEKKIGGPQIIGPSKNISLIQEPQSYMKLIEEVLSDDLFEQ